MKYTYYSPLFSMFTKMVGPGKQEKNINMPVASRVGIKFDIISVGKLYPGKLVVKKYSWFEAEGKSKPSV